MHVPTLFQQEDLAVVKDFLRQNAFGILINKTENRYWGTHIPLELETDEEGTEVLYGHISKANPQWKYFEAEEEVLAIFSGPHTYISSSWYDHENVPTWNYAAVHVYGKVQALNETELMQSLKRLVDKYEVKSAHPVRLEEMPPHLLKQAKGVFGFKMIITEVQVAYKLSQNRHDKDYQNIISELEKRSDFGDEGVAAMMRQNRK